MLKWISDVSISGKCGAKQKILIIQNIEIINSDHELMACLVCNYLGSPLIVLVLTELWHDHCISLYHSYHLSRLSSEIIAFLTGKYRGEVHRHGISELTRSNHWNAAMNKYCWFGENI
jgi:hypothetical protein